jgi:hypothetical protein
MLMNVNGYDEYHTGLFALSVEEAKAYLHRLNAGTSFSFILKKFFAEAEIFYSGLFGDTRPSTDISMQNDDSAYTLNSKGFQQDEHSVSIGLNVGINIISSAWLYGGYTFSGGKNMMSHQGNITMKVSL